MTRFGRRRVLEVIAGAGAISTAGCTGQLSFPGDRTGRPGESTGVGDWPMQRGTAANAGVSGSGGPGSTATSAFTAEFRNGLLAGFTAPTVGSDAIYGAAKIARPAETEPPTYGGYVYRLSRADGTEQWRVPIETREGEAFATFFARHPGSCLGPDGLYVCWVRNLDDWELVVQSHSLDDGRRQWRQTFPSANLAPEPVVRGDTLYLLWTGRLLALSTEDGSREWTTERFRYDQRTPTVGEDVVVVGNEGFEDGDDRRQVTAFDRSDGSVRWSKPTRMRYGQHTAPSVVDNTVYLAEGITADIGTVEELPPFAIRAFDADDGSEHWSHTYKQRSDHAMLAGGTTSVAVDEQRVYYGLLYPTPEQVLEGDATEVQRREAEEFAFTGESLVALDRSDGTVQWTADLGTYAQVYSYLVVDADHVYAQRSDHDGDGAAEEWVVVDKDSGEIAGRVGRPADTNYGRAFGVAGGELYEHVGDGVRVWN